jgi:hypothetical protein
LVLLSAAFVAHPMQGAGVGIRMDSATVQAGGKVEYRVQVLDGATGQPVTDADVSASYRKADGTDSAGTPLEASGDGYYRGSLQFPKGGDWVVHISSGATTIELTQTVPDFAPPTTVARGSTASEGSDGGSGWVIAGVAAGVLVVVVVGALVARRRRTPDPTAEPVD